MYSEVAFTDKIRRHDGQTVLTACEFDYQFTWDDWTDATTPPVDDFTAATPSHYTSAAFGGADSSAVGRFYNVSHVALPQQ